MRAIDRTSGRELASRLSVATGLLARSKGLLGRKSLSPGEGLLLAPCNGVHTFFMKFPIDVIFLDKHDRVIEAVHNLKPYRMTRLFFTSRRAIELPAGTLPASGTDVGNHLLIE